ncbi:MAG: tetratricopeptide repeat protein [Gammaproteobacteria bacterium]
MVYPTLRAFILACVSTGFLGACSSLAIQPNQSGAGLDNQDNILNLLDPDVKNEEQAFAKAEAIYQQGKSENALFYYIKTLQFNQNNIKAMERIAAIHIRSKHPELAVKVYKDLLVIDGNNVSANEFMGLHYLDNGQRGKAKQHLAKVVKYGKNSWRAHNGLGVIADLEHNSDEAIAHYEAALEIDPANPMLLNNLGYSHYLSGNPVKAKMLYTQALNYDGKYKRAIHNLALIEIRNGHFTTATALFNRIMPVHDSYNNVGYICMVNGQYAAAEEYFRRAIDESPVYFPKAQDNLKTLMSLKSGPVTGAPVSSMPAVEAFSEVSVPTSPAPARIPEARPAAPRAKPAAIAESPQKKTAENRSNGAKKKTAGQPLARSRPDVKSSTTKKRSEPTQSTVEQPKNLPTATGATATVGGEKSAPAPTPRTESARNTEASGPAKTKDAEIHPTGSPTAESASQAGDMPVQENGDRPNEPAEAELIANPPENPSSASTAAENLTQQPEPERSTEASEASDTKDASIDSTAANPSRRPDDSESPDTKDAAIKPAESPMVDSSSQTGGAPSLDIQSTPDKQTEAEIIENKPEAAAPASTAAEAPADQPASAGSAEASEPTQSGENPAERTKTQQDAPLSQSDGEDDVGQKPATSDDAGNSGGNSGNAATLPVPAVDEPSKSQPTPEPPARKAASPDSQ